MTTWLFSGAAVTGRSHVSTSQPCQDKFSIQTSVDGEWLSVAVCDGAGSAEFAEIGAAITSTYFCDELINLSRELDRRPPGEWINDFVIDCVIRVREQIREKAKSDDIRKFHCTLVAALIGKSGGFLVHIGDGSAFGGFFEKYGQNGSIELNSNYTISLPENGEYSNETFFITEGHWIKHLRITPLPALDWLVVCTDGGASLLLDNDNRVKPSFLAPFIESQVNSNFLNKKYIEEVLSDPQANKLTTDDKTIVLAVRKDATSIPIKFHFSSKTDGRSSERLVQTDFPGSSTKKDGVIESKKTDGVDASHRPTEKKNRHSPEKKNYQDQTADSKKSIFIFSLVFLVGTIVGSVAAIYFWDDIRGLISFSKVSHQRTDARVTEEPSPPPGRSSSDTQVNSHPAPPIQESPSSDSQSPGQPNK